MSDSHVGRRRHLLPVSVFALISLVYLAAAFALASRRAPWNDEGWFADPAYTLLTKGYMGSPIIHPRGTWVSRELTGVQTHTYWIMPGSPVLQSIWYRVFGFGLLQMRAVSIFAGLIVIWAWASVIWHLTGNRVAAWLTAALLALDVTFLFGASDGRMDMTTVAFGSLGLAVFVAFRQKNLTASLMAANAFVAAGILCHPNGAIYGLMLLLFLVFCDFRALRWHHLVCLIPYFLFAGAWGIYILQSPGNFVAQFTANASTPFGDRTAGLHHPLHMLAYEITGRYVEHFGGSSVWAQLPPFTKAIPLIFLLSTAWLALDAARTRNRANAFITVCLAVVFVFMGVFVALKGAYYLNAIVPLYAAAVALAAFPEAGRFNRVPLALLTFLVLIQGLSIYVVLHQDGYHTGYLPAVAYLKSHASPQTSINGSPALLFGLPGYDLISDSRLHDPAEYIVVDRWTLYDWGFVYRTFEPQTAAAVQKKLACYDDVFDRDGWRILHRRKQL